MPRGTISFLGSGDDYPWVVQRHGEYETELRDYILREKPEINLDPIFESAENLLSYMPNPGKYNNDYTEKEDIIKDGANKEMVGLLYGRVQSGKTIASISLTALAADNGYRNIIVLTSNVELLHQQTMQDFETNLYRVKVFGEPTTKGLRDYSRDLQNTSVDEIVVITGKKNNTSLKNIESAISGQRGLLPTLIIDDEGDQASLNIGKRNSNSEIYQRIIDIRNSIGLHCYISVTATPYANLLLDPQKESELYPYVIQCLPPGEGYTGADVFFKDRLKDIWREIAVEEKESLKFHSRDATLEDTPPGLKKAVIYHLLACRVRKMFDIRGEHSMLLNVHKDKKSHSTIQKNLESFLNFLSEACKIGSDKWTEIESISDGAFRDIQSTFEPLIDRQIDVRSELYQSLESKSLSIQIINADNPNPPKYGGDFTSTFLIGQTKLGRGLRIRGLVTTYFLYTPKIANMDSYSQACRFFGYRGKILRLMRIFSPESTIRRWQHIRTHENYTYEYLKSIENGSLEGLISLERPLMLLQSQMKSARKVKGQTDHEIASPISNVLYQMRKIPDGENSEFNSLKLDLLDKEILKVDLTHKIIDLFDKPREEDIDWPTGFLKNVLKNVHSEDPYKSSGLKVIQSSNTLRLEEGDNLPAMSDEEYENILQLSEGNYIVIFLRDILRNGRQMVMPCCYLPSLEHGFHVK